MNIETPFATPRSDATPLVTVLGSQRIHAPFELILPCATFRLRKGGFKPSELSSSLALERLRKIAERERRIGVAPAQATFVEISSTSALFRGNTPLPQEWLVKTYPDLMNDPMLAKQIWHIVSIPDASRRSHALAVRPEITGLLSEAELSDLAEIAFRRISETQMAEDLAAMAKEFPKLTIVTPYHALKSSGKIFHNRSRLINDLEDILSNLGVPWFDPSPLVVRFGQELALTSSPSGHDGFTSGFVRMVAAHLAANHLQDLSPDPLSLTNIRTASQPIAMTQGM